MSAQPFDKETQHGNRSSCPYVGDMVGAVLVDGTSVGLYVGDREGWRLGLDDTDGKMDGMAEGSKLVEGFELMLGLKLVDGTRLGDSVLELGKKLTDGSDETDGISLGCILMVGNEGNQSD